MSILIKGMEMPTSCAKCKLVGEYGCAFIGAVGYALTEGRRSEDCPLVPVPPHGRLIDADALEEEIWSVRRQYQLCDDTQSADKMMHGVYRAERLLKDAPTIIEAEDKE